MIVLHPVLEGVDIRLVVAMVAHRRNVVEVTVRVERHRPAQRGRDRRARRRDGFGMTLAVSHATDYRALAVTTPGVGQHVAQMGRRRPFHGFVAVVRHVGRGGRGDVEGHCRPAARAAVRIRQLVLEGVRAGVVRAPEVLEAAVRVDPHPAAVLGLTRGVWPVVVRVLARHRDFVAAFRGTDRRDPRRNVRRLLVVVQHVACRAHVRADRPVVVVDRDRRRVLDVDRHVGQVARGDSIAIDRSVLEEVDIRHGVAMVAYWRNVVEVAVRVDRHRPAQRGRDRRAACGHRVFDAVGAHHGVHAQILTGAILAVAIRAVVAQDIAYRRRPFIDLVAVGRRWRRWRLLEGAAVTAAAAPVDLSAISRPRRGSNRLTVVTAVLQRRHFLDEASQPDPAVSASIAANGTRGGGFHIVEVGLEALDEIREGLRRHLGFIRHIRRRHGELRVRGDDGRRAAIVRSQHDPTVRAGNERFAIMKRIAGLEGTEAIRAAREGISLDRVNGCHDLIRYHCYALLMRPPVIFSTVTRAGTS